MITFSVVVTVFNEEKTIGPLLESLLTQKLLPAEIIVVDAGSLDKTVALVKGLAKTSRVPIRLVEHPGCNRSMGRNIGIAKAQHDHIAVIDAGCVADAAWLLVFADAFTAGTMSVAGYYAPVAASPFQDLVAAYTCTLPHQFIRETFLPSSRSLAFTKEAWRLAGTYPEDLETCEDLIYARLLKDLGGMVVTEKALVHWQQAESVSAYFRQIFGYAQGDVLAGYQPHVIRIMTVWLRYLLFVLWPGLLVLYVGWIYYKHWLQVKSVKHGVLLPFVQGVTDVAVMAGSLVGVVKRLFN
jgi:glycosyltransferase involved in cell wall biosynthesis